MGAFPFVTRPDRLFVVSAVSLLPIPRVIPSGLRFDDVLCEEQGLEEAWLGIGMTAIETMGNDGVAEVVAVAAVAAVAVAAVASVQRDIEDRMGWKEKMTEFRSERRNLRFAFFAERMRRGLRKVEAGVAWV